MHGTSYSSWWTILQIFLISSNCVYSWVTCFCLTMSGLNMSSYFTLLFATSFDCMCDCNTGQVRIFGNVSSWSHPKGQSTLENVPQESFLMVLTVLVRRARSISTLCLSNNGLCKYFASSNLSYSTLSIFEWPLLTCFRFSNAAFLTLTFTSDLYLSSFIDIILFLHQKHLFSQGCRSHQGKDYLSVHYIPPWQSLQSLFQGLFSDSTIFCFLKRFEGNSSGFQEQCLY